MRHGRVVEHGQVDARDAQHHERVERYLPEQDRPAIRPCPPPPACALVHGSVPSPRLLIREETDPPDVTCGWAMWPNSLSASSPRRRPTRARGTPARPATAGRALLR